MQEKLISRLYIYLQDHHPDLLLQLEDNDGTAQYLSEKVAPVEQLVLELLVQNTSEIEIEEMCMEQLTADLRPSRYDYILQLLQDEFEHVFHSFISIGILKTEAINMVNYCASVFDDLVFNKSNEDNRFIRYAITGMIKDYLESNSVNETESDELQQSAKTQGQY